MNAWSLVEWRRHCQTTAFDASAIFGKSFESHRWYNNCETETNLPVLLPEVGSFIALCQTGISWMTQIYMNSGLN